MTNENETFTLRFYENGINPESFSAKELGQIAISFYDGVKQYIDDNYPNVNPEDVTISLVAIENKSNSLIFKSSQQPEVETALGEIGNSITNNSYTDLPYDTYKTIKLIQNISKRKSCSVELVQRGKRLFVVTPEFEFIEQEKVLVKSSMVLYGLLNKIGGNKTKAWVELYDGSKVSFPITDEQLIQLRGKVKEPVALKGFAKWNTLSQKVVSFKLDSVIDYNSGNVKDGIEKIKNVSNGWDDINSHQGIINFFKGEA